MTVISSSNSIKPCGSSSSSSNGTTKENNGKAARRQRGRKIAWALACTATVCLMVTVGRRQQQQQKQQHGGRHNGSHKASSSLSASTVTALRGFRDTLQQAVPNLVMDQAGWMGGASRMRHHGEPIHRNAGGNDNEDEETVIDKILRAEYHLIDLHVNPGAVEDSLNDQDLTAYDGLHGVFCQVHWQAHKDNPSLVPMFRDLVAQSPKCDRPTRLISLAPLVRRVREYDQQQQQATTTKVLQLAGVVFHESRCGSTLVANVLASMMPAQHRVYSESSPPITALKYVCGEDYDRCPIETAATVLQDVIYLMSRSNDVQEERVFFKIQSLGSRNIAVFQRAFPDTPWIFVYREPVQVMMSQLAHGVAMANCVRPQRSAPILVQNIVHDRHGITGDSDARRINPTDYCAAHLASIAEAAVKAMQHEREQETTAKTNLGRPVNYADLPDMLWQDLLPNHFHVPVGQLEMERMKSAASQYSKGRDGQHAGTFHEDSTQKEAAATPEIRNAATVYLLPSFQILQEMKQQHQQ